MYGLPVDLSADEFVGLVLNLPRARMWAAYQGAVAADVAAGKPGPIDYYDLFAPDRATASKMLGEQVLANLMSL